MKFKVTDPKGIHVNGRLAPQGEEISIPDGAARKAFLHFKQVEEVKEEGGSEPEAPKPKGGKGKSKSGDEESSESEAPKPKGD